MGNSYDEAFFASQFGIGDSASIDSGFVLTFGELPYDTVNSAHRQFLSLTTAQWYLCYNQYIIADVEVSSGHIRVDIEGVQLPGYRFQDALRQSDISELFILQPARYDIEIRYGQVTGRFVLKVTDSSLEVHAIEEGIFTLQDTLYWRYRPMSCAYVCGMSYADTTACDMLLDSILSKVPLTRYEYPAAGVRPYPTASQGHYVEWGAQYFTYQSDADFDRAGELLHAYGKSQWAWNSGNGAFLVNYRGKKYYSWSP
jgi:hypothetical protein